MSGPPVSLPLRLASEEFESTVPKLPLGRSQLPILYKTNYPVSPTSYPSHPLHSTLESLSNFQYTAESIPHLLPSPAFPTTSNHSSLLLPSPGYDGQNMSFLPDEVLRMVLETSCRSTEDAMWGSLNTRTSAEVERAPTGASILFPMGLFLTGFIGECFLDVSLSYQEKFEYELF